MVPKTPSFPKPLMQYFQILIDLGDPGIILLKFVQDVAIKNKHGLKGMVRL